MYTTGIDGMAFHFPKLYLPIKELAKERNIEVDKLEKGLGLKRIALLDTNQDIISMAANACFKLITQEKLIPSEIDRVYVASESHFDSSKPIASYVLGLLEQKFGNKSFNHCDAVDFTFACIGGVDAFENCLDYIRLNPKKKAIVITTDLAKYDLESTGEYTQGAGAIALLITSNPRIISFQLETGIATQSVFDFFKPKRYIKDTSLAKRLNQTENSIAIHKDQPIFDGKYSNECYIARTTEAYKNFVDKNDLDKSHFENWDLITMHLPYAFQGRRTFFEIIAQNKFNWNKEDINYFENCKNYSKSDEYKNFITKKIAPTELGSSLIGNIYTGSIFLGLISALENALINNIELTEKYIGFIAYGSGSKSKVFEGKLDEKWKEQIEKLNLFSTLENNIPVDFNTYYNLYNKITNEPILDYKNEFILNYIEENNEILMGSRIYKYI